MKNWYTLVSSDDSHFKYIITGLCVSNVEAKYINMQCLSSNFFKALLTIWEGKIDGKSTKFDLYEVPSSIKKYSLNKTKLDQCKKLVTFDIANAELDIEGNILIIETEPASITFLVHFLNEHSFTVTCPHIKVKGELCEL